MWKVEAWNMLMSPSREQTKEIVVSSVFMYLYLWWFISAHWIDRANWWSVCSAWLSRRRWTLIPEQKESYRCLSVFFVGSPKQSHEMAFFHTHIISVTVQHHFEALKASVKLPMSALHQLSQNTELWTWSVLNKSIEWENYIKIYSSHGVGCCCGTLLCTLASV